MNKERYKSILLTGVILFSIITFLSCSAKKVPEKAETKAEETKDNNNPVERIIAEGNQGSPDKKVQIPENTNESGITEKVPWENDQKFMAAQQQNGAFERMAAYRTVLHDPLPGEEYNVHLGASMLAGTVINPGEEFSQNKKIGPYVELRGFKKGPTYDGSKLITTIGGGVCKIASALYNVVILSNLQVTERHNHQMPVPYVPYGQDATVWYNKHDFKFKNNTASPVLVWAQGVGNILYIGFYSSHKAPKVEWHHEILSKEKAPTVYKDVPSLTSGAERKVSDGLDGATVRSWVTVENPDGSKSEKQLGKSYYKPLPTIIER